MTVLIPKGDSKDFRDIGLVEVLWKATTSIINRRLTAVIRYHDSLNFCWTGLLMGTSTLESNLIHQLMAMREAVLHTISWTPRRSKAPWNGAGASTSWWDMAWDPGRSGSFGRTGLICGLWCRQRWEQRDSWRKSRIWRLSSMQMTGWLCFPIRIGCRCRSTSSQTSSTGLSPHKLAEDSEHGLPALLHPWQIVRVGVHAESEGDRPLITRETVAGVRVIGVRRGSVSGFLDEIYPGVARRRLRGPRENSPPPPPPTGESKTYQVYFPSAIMRLRCPVARCQGGETIRTNLQVHFAHRHVKDDVVILEEGNHPYPRCPKCEMFVSQQELNVRDNSTALCQQGEDHKQRHMAAEEAEAREAMALTAYGRPLTEVSSFKYLGRVL